MEFEASNLFNCQCNNDPDMQVLWGGSWLAERETLGVIISDPGLLANLAGSGVLWGIILVAKDVILGWLERESLVLLLDFWAGGFLAGLQS